MSAASPSSPATRIIPPGGVIGIVGGGQLGRMAALAAARLGYRCHIFTPDKDSPAAQVSAALTLAEYDDAKALTAFAKAVDVVTFEFENIPAESVRLLAEIVPVRPSWNVLDTAQDRIAEKSFFNGLGIATAPWRAVSDEADLAKAVGELGRPSILKTTRLGYDGKGQVRIEGATDLGEAWAALGTDQAILEGFVDFDREISVVVARGMDGRWAAFDPVENRHVHHILDVTIAPAAITPDQADRAIAIARHAAEALQLVGLLAVEMFVAGDGKILVNEMAPRPHNSGHWTMDACVTDQFEQFIRAVCGLPLGATDRHSDAEMKNLIGDDVTAWADILKEPGSRLHLYGKATARPGRKMGHVTRLKPKSGR